MGKSPGKWIKTVLFGKKHSKANLSKAAANTPVEKPAGDSSLVTDPPLLTSRDAENTGFGKGVSGTPYDSTGLYPGNQDVDLQSNFVPVPPGDVEMIRQEKAATKTQAAFRGYLARRAFRALKGIIRLQALIRGHLVRRQAVATLRCMQGIVKFQAVARGRRVRLSNSLSGWCKKYNIVEFQVTTGASSYLGSENLASKRFVRKLLIQLPTSLPLSLQYDLSEPNSAWNWLERWSISHFWKPCAHSKNVLIKPQQKQGGTQAVEFRTGRSKRTVRKVSALVNGDTGYSASVDADKPKRNPRKITSHQTELVQDQTQSELERVKRNLRKVSASTAVASEKSETQNEKPQPEPQASMKIVLNTAASDVPEQKKVILSENPTESNFVADKPALEEVPSNMTAMDELVDGPQDDHPVAELQSLENGGKSESPQTLNEELISKEEHSNKENQKIKKRRSLTTKQEHPENILPNAPSVPSYMAATESAKAKLRAQGSSKTDEDDADHVNARRHSLPAGTNGKLSSPSPRIQKPIQANGKGGNKPSRSLTVSKDDKTQQPGWRR
ncbi:protein IQ-DOMAIN 29-like isoform X2 [Henckelia pumila]|uniref:protein IQ-DOMAIN 29-like isoform X2 n=1 Tax=Henckelia pumila TaxID=405737 RepID=UPI003C6E6109